MTRGHNRREKARRKRRRMHGAYVAKKDAARLKAADLLMLTSAAALDTMTAQEAEAIAISARMSGGMLTMGVAGAGSA